MRQLKCLASLIVFFLGACAATPIKESNEFLLHDPSSGYVVLSLAEVLRPGSEPFPGYTTITFQRVDGPGKASMTSPDSQWSFSWEEPDWRQTNERGRVFALKLATGTWRLGVWKLTFPGVLWNSDISYFFEPVSFKVQSGEIRYIGRIHMSYEIGWPPGWIGGRRLVALSISLSDQYLTDGPYLESRYPRLPVDLVRVDVPEAPDEIAILPGRPHPR